MKVAIVGYGVEGRASYRYWLEKGDEVTIVDEKEEVADLPSEARVILGSNALQQLEDFDLIVRTPPLRPDRIKTNGKIWSATNEFFAQCPAPIIGVTGTKGKGTTTTLISRILENVGFKTWLVGNIGIPALEVLEEIKQHTERQKAKSKKQKASEAVIPAEAEVQSDNLEQNELVTNQISNIKYQISDAPGVVVFELSSFQLWDLEKSPETAVVLMIEPDHMDVHTSMEEYVTAKANITAHQSEKDVVVYHPANTYSAEIAEQSPGIKKQYMTPDGAYIDGDRIIIEGRPICKTEEVGLIGKHNLENICAAITAVWIYTQDTEAVKTAIISFKGLPHRLEFAGEMNGIRFYDDSQATGVGSALAALRSFSSPTVLIFGGSDKGVDVFPVIEELDPARHSVVLIGQVSDKLEALLKERSFTAYTNLGMNTTMPEIVSEANELSVPGGVVLLSPAHASFGMFKNYQDRGDQFKAAVQALSESA